MLFYTANPNNAQPILSFRQRGIANLMPSRPSDLQLYAFSTDSYNPMATEYFNRLPDVVLSTLTNNVIIRETSFKKVLDYIPAASYGRPILTVDLDNLSQEDVIRMQSFKMTRDSTDPHVWNGTPSHKDAIEILKLSPKQKMKAGSVECVGYLAFYQLVRGARLMAEVTKVFEYPRNVYRYDPNQAVSGREIDGDKKDVPVLFGTGLAAGVRGGMQGDTATLVSSFAREQSVILPLNASKSFTKASIAYTKADITTEGLMFAYFKGLLLPDRDFLYRKVGQYLLTCLADTPEDAMELYKGMRDGIRGLATLDAGHILSHMFIGIDLAIAAKATLQFLTVNAEYAGFLLQSPNMRVIQRGQVLKNRDVMELAQDVKELDAHRAALREIIDIIRSVMVNGVPKYNHEFEDIEASPRKLNKILTELIDTDFTVAQNEAVDRAIGRLTYEQEFLEPTAENILIFLNFMETSNEELIDDWPMYYAGGHMKVSNRIERALLAFGPRAPSLRLGGKKIMTIPNSISQVDTNLAVNTDKQRNWRYMPFTLKAAREAANDWMLIFTTGKVPLPLPKKDSTAFIDREHVDVAITHDQGIVDIYEAVKRNVVKLAPTGSAGSKKRKAEMGDDGERLTKKQVKENKKARDVKMANLF